MSIKLNRLLIKPLVIGVAIFALSACDKGNSEASLYKNSTLIVDEIPGRAVNDPDFPPGRLLHIAENGDVIFDTNMLKMPYDAVAMPDGTYWVSLIRENALWRINRNSEVVEVLYVGVYPTAFSVLDNGNILVSGWDDDHPGFVREYNADHEIVWQIEDLKWPWKAQRLKNGNTLIADAGLNRVYEVTKDLEEVWSFDNFGPDVNELFDGLGPIYVQRLDNGNTLISARAISKIVEVDQNGTVVWDVGKPLIDTQYSAVRLKNGNTLIADAGHTRVIEIDPDKNIVWEKSGFGYPAKAYRVE
ncbi:MAG: hypothetical protein KDF58_07740 [Alphaproteobacteria bacterium]|nr:hypothetical protein [Alphaproteobacteria bacterium]HPF47275.1 hypothetical protein [Emcibacteraceae bacterium]